MCGGVGKDASRMLGKMQTRPDDQDPRIDDLTPEEQTWYTATPVDPASLSLLVERLAAEAVCDPW